MTELKLETVGQEHRAGGTSLLGYLDTSYAELVRTFGEPSGSDGYKTDAEWVIWFPEQEVVATVYDYKTGVNYCGADGVRPEDNRNWHIGGHVHAAVELVEIAIHLSEPKPELES